MTENEIIETHIAENIHRIEVIEWFMRSNSSADKEKCEKNKKVLTSVNGLLQEIQQYRAIGTVEKIKEELDRLRNDNECQGLYFTLEERKALAKQSRELSEYKEIGTIEDFKALKIAEEMRGAK